MIFFSCCESTINNDDGLIINDNKLDFVLEKMKDNYKLISVSVVFLTIVSFFDPGIHSFFENYILDIGYHDWSPIMKEIAKEKKDSPNWIEGNDKITLNRGKLNNFERLMLSPFLAWLCVFIIPIIYLYIEKIKITINEYFFFLMYFFFLTLITFGLFQFNIGYCPAVLLNENALSPFFFFIKKYFHNYVLISNILLVLEFVLGIIASFVGVFYLDYLRKNLKTVKIIFYILIFLQLIQLIIQYKNLKDPIKFTFKT